MTVEEQEREIGGVTFRVKPLDFRKGRAGLLRLTGRIGPALGLGGEQRIADAVSAITNSFTEEDFEWFSEVFGATTRFSTDGQAWPYLKTVKPAQDHHDELFSGNLMLYLQWLAFCIEVNYSDFFELAVSALSEIGQLLQGGEAGSEQEQGSE